MKETTSTALSDKRRENIIKWNAKIRQRVADYNHDRIKDIPIDPDYDDLGYEDSFDPRYIKLIEVYIKECVDAFETDENGNIKRSINIPTMLGFARWMRCDIKTIHQWAERYSEFADQIKQLYMETYVRTVNGSLSGKYNPYIAGRMLAANYGVRENKEADDTPETQYNAAHMAFQQLISDVSSKQPLPIELKVIEQPSNS